MQAPFVLCLKLLIAITWAAATCAAFAADVVPTRSVPWPSAGWQESTPEQQGMASFAVQRLVDFGAKNGMDSLLVVRHGHVVVDAYYAPFQPGLKHHTYSATKAVLATLVGIAVKDGLLQGVTQSVLPLFPAALAAQQDAQKKTITIGHLLDMSSGLDWREPLDGAPESLRDMRRSPDWSAFVLNRPMVLPPGSSFNYNSGNSQVLSALLTQASGKSAADFAKERLFGPLGIADVLWRTDPQGHSTGGFGLYMHPRDMAKIGYLYLHGGRWEDRQLLPPSWSDSVLHATLDMRLGSTAAFTYAKGWWTIPQQDVIMAVGYLQQIIMVLPKRDMVVVVTGKKPPRFGALIDLVEAASASTQPLPANPKATAELVRRVREVGSQARTPIEPPSELARRVSGRTYRFERNALGLNSLVLDLTAANAQYEMRFDATNPTAGKLRFAGPIGLDGAFRANPQSDAPLLAAKAHWSDAATLSLVSQWVTDGVLATYTLRFGDDRLDIDYRDNSGLTVRLQGTAAP